MSTRVLAPVLTATIAAGATFDLVDALGAFSGRPPDTVNWLSAIGGLTFWVATIICVVFAVLRKPLAFAWTLAPVSGALLAAGYYVHTAPYCRGCKNAATYPSAEPWVFAVAGACVLAGAITARWPRFGLVATVITMLGAVALGFVIGYHTIT